MKRGVVRKLDELGRLVIPKEYRKALAIKEQEAMEMVLEDNYIKVIPSARCLFCACEDVKQLIEKNEKFICVYCVGELEALKKVGNWVDFLEG